MAKHEFGIMMNTPRQSERYDEYEPWKYECISVDDKDLEGVVERLSSIDFYWHTLSVKGKGLTYCGGSCYSGRWKAVLLCSRG